MSSASPFRRSAPDRPSARSAEWVRSRLVDSAQFAGFWSSVALPFAMLTLVASGSAAEQAPLFVALLVANVVALRIGHGYKQH
ncbi:hypothetical protein [Halosimplex salinum]|uniref:hypothetical protein n=1 Tax=Halosimplex salinum TaxID=1710538 RepID=UPI0013DE2A40|nr:hypothetical protein [Halosimplex salinum]